MAQASGSGGRPIKICLIGLGTIGTCFLALHLKHSSAVVQVFDTRPDLEAHVRAALPGFLEPAGEELQVDRLLSSGRVVLARNLAEALNGVSIVQEQGPENVHFKRYMWADVDRLAAPHAHFWSSTSGIPASAQAVDMSEAGRRRLLVLHPFNPSHIMPLLELVPSPRTAAAEVDYFARSYFAGMGAGHRVVVIRREMPGFVGNRLGFVLFREACYLVATGVVGVEDVDAVVEGALGPRWALNGPFKTYHAGGGHAGLDGFMNHLGATIESVWEDAGHLSMKDSGAGGDEKTLQAGLGGWRREIVRQTESAFGLPTPADFAARDRALRQVLAVQDEMRKRVKDEA